MKKNNLNSKKYMDLGGYTLKGIKMRNLVIILAIIILITSFTTASFFGYNAPSNSVIVGGNKTINITTNIYNTYSNNSWNESLAYTLFAPNTTAGIQSLINGTGVYLNQTTLVNLQNLLNGTGIYSGSNSSWNESLAYTLFYNKTANINTGIYNITASYINNLNISNDGTKTTLLGTAGDYLRIGDAGTTAASLNSEDDLLITGELEVNGRLYSKSNNYFDGATDSNDPAHFEFRENGTTMAFLKPFYGFDQMCLFVETQTGNQFILGKASSWDKDFDHVIQTNPTLFIHSATNPDTNNTQWLSLTHDQTNGVISTGTGYLDIQSNNTPISLYVRTNVSATGYITRTSVYDKSRGNAYDFIQDAGYYLKSDGTINHSKFYGYAGKFNVTNYSKPITTFVDSISYNETLKLNQTISSPVITYPTKQEEGILLDREIDVLRQALYEQKLINQQYKSALCEIKPALELCK